MRCNAWIRKTEQPDSLLNVLHPDVFAHLEKCEYTYAGELPRRAWSSRPRVTRELLEERHQYARCPGTVTCDIEAEDEGEEGHPYPVVRVLYRCDTCRNTDYPSLPSDRHDVAALVTRHITEMPDPE